jgi:hypothetical protein
MAIIATVGVKAAQRIAMMQLGRLRILVGNAEVYRDVNGVLSFRLRPLVSPTRPEDIG